ncbi:hypothetical protein AURDEDRAFT_174914 [Auricularia subglabra TFB-10046 SS5]|uniref:F-box domain-containing protein n=1 Tax=Auricularia subglabra (strain TFB-10046 / SS5) TaxID=717982 RepID=J0CY15_AURST|nr:hypothetical protein AURDEDRAFT_174914 [Auricularia subglabra TFB-10046 SS5]
MHDTCPVLEILNMPQLESLTLARRQHHKDQVTKKQVAALLHFHTTGNLPLREFRLSDLWISDADLLQIMKRSPRLELLAIVNGKTSDKFLTQSSTKRGRPARWICPNLSRVCIMTDHSSKSDKFKVSKEGMGAFVAARLRVNQASSTRGGAPSVSRLMNVRLDEDDIIFDNILNVDWAWSHDDTCSPHRRLVAPWEYNLDAASRWWMSTRHWEDLL